MSAVSVKFISMEHVLRANTQAMTAACSPESADIISICIALWNGLSKILQRDSVLCVDRNSNGPKRLQFQFLSIPEDDKSLDPHWN